jgi:hypothetical protein
LKVCVLMLCLVEVRKLKEEHSLFEKIKIII